jgi:hypothetical protein
MKIMLTLLATILVSAVLSPLAVAKKQPTNDQAVAAITQLENDAVKLISLETHLSSRKITPTIGPAASAVESGQRKNPYWRTQRTRPTTR